MFLMFVTDPQPLTGNLCVDLPGFCDTVDKTAANISPLYQLDAFDWTVLVIYFGILAILSIYGAYRVKQVIEFWRYSKFPPKPKREFAEAELPRVTVQLPLFNEMYVVERFARAGFDIHYLHRNDRTGFKSGALEHGMKTAKGDLIAIFDADFVPRPDFLRKLIHYFTDGTVGCSQMRWAHINGSYNLLTRRSEERRVGKECRSR